MPPAFEELLQAAFGGVPGVDPLLALGLCAVSFVTSAIAATFSLGGGVLMLVILAGIYPPAVLIPIHGAVQIGSNIGRAIILSPHIVRTAIPAFLIGSAIGAAIGGQLVVALPKPLLQFILAVFILYSVWGPRMEGMKLTKPILFAMGSIGSLVSMFVGSTGPLIGSFTARVSTDRREVVATTAAFMTIQHGVKVMAFGMLGFAFAAYLPLIAGMILCGFAGTVVGRKLLHHLPERAFRIALKTIITVLALRLLYDAAEGWISPPPAA